MTTIVLSGSGVLYPVHIGACQKIYEHFRNVKGKNWTPSHIIGTSGGSIVAAYLASGFSPEEALELAKALLPKDVIAPNWKCFFKNHWGLLSLDGLEKQLSTEIVQRFCDVKTNLSVVVTDVSTKKTLVFSNDSTPKFSVAKAVRASATIPIVFDTFKIKGTNSLVVDGGVTNNYAIDLAKGPTIGIRLLSETDGITEAPDTLMKFLFSVLNTMMSEIARKHIEDAGHFARTVNIRVPFNPMDFLKLDSDAVERLYKIGYDSMSKKIAAGFKLNDEA